MMEFVTVAQFLAEADEWDNEPPEPDEPPSWEDLIPLEPGLADLLVQAQSYRRQRGKPFCANDIYYGDIKPKLLALVGWEREAYPDLLRTSAAYNVAREIIYNALPDCHRCACWPHGGV
jgi:hypothetical protein